VSDGPAPPGGFTTWHDLLLDWYAEHARDLPWRRPDVTPWGVLVSEVMLQQTPVARVRPVWQAWADRWPTPRALACDTPGEAVRAWGRLGYPRRALRLHEAATVVCARHDGQVPSGYPDLLALPGVGEYTAAAVAAFAFGAHHPVVDGNVARVLARAVTGRQPTAGAPSREVRACARAALPAPGEGSAQRSATWSVAVMELGALVCTARSPRCVDCPLHADCAWLAAGRPGADARPTRPQPWVGTDRQARGRLLAVVRDHPGPVPLQRLHDAWPHPAQRARALDGLLADGLVEQVEPDRYALPR
jgi:A/G-specific adenine glycosylase